MGLRRHARVWLAALALAVAVGEAHAQPAPPPKLDARADATPGEAPVPHTGATPGAAAGHADPCGPGNFVAGARLSAPGERSEHYRIRDGRLAREGSEWSSAAALQLPERGARIVIDFATPRDVQHLVLQGDNNDQYVVEGSLDGVHYRPLWTALEAEGQGLRTRHVALPRAERVQHLRVTPRGGDGFYSISELRAHCKTPTPWPPALNVAPKRPGLLGMWDWIDNDRMVMIKGGLAAFGTLILLWGAFWRWRGKPDKHKTARDVALALAGFVAFFSWWNLGHFHFDHYVHIWEHYHYYMGAKYGPELRFARLYECTAVADVQDGLGTRVRKRKMRDLGETNELGTTAEIVRDPKRCTAHFTPERWDAFRKDIRFFRGRFSRDRWDQSQTDHGYNGTPVWAIAGRLIADRVPLSWEAIERMAYVDSAILVGMWAIVCWAFGWRATCVALLWWGTNFPARFYWNGGSFLRYDWIVWIAVGISLLRKDKHLTAGLALTYATLLRIFPGFVVAALVLKALARMFRERRFVLSKGHVRFAAGCILALATLLPASSWATGGIDAWSEFAQNSQKHLKTALTNNMGLKTVLGYDFATRAQRMRNNSLEDPFAEWKDARGYFYAKREPLLIALVFLFCLMLARAGDREPDWVAACLGTGLIVMAAELTCYYYGFLLGYGLLWGRRMLPGIAATALASATCWLSFIPWNDDHFGAMSLLCVITVVGVTAQIAFGRPVRATLN